MHSVRSRRHPDGHAGEGRRLPTVQGDGGEQVHLHPGRRAAGVHGIQLLRQHRPSRRDHFGRPQRALLPQRRTAGA